MQLTALEHRMVERMRKQERQWRWARWLTLFMGVFQAATGIAVLCVIMPRIESGREDMASSALILSLSYPFILLCAGSATLFLCLAIRDWHGNTTRTLLLRLLDYGGKTESSK